MSQGSGLLKAGFAGSELPKALFPALVGRTKYPRVMAGAAEADLFVGDAAREQRGVLRLSHPIAHGVVVDWEDMSAVWQHAFAELGVAQDQHPVLLTEAALNPRAGRGKAAELFFEAFSVPAFYVELQAILALYASGRTTGVVLDCGDGTTQAVPVVEGFVIPHAVTRMDVAGRDVTHFLQRLLRRAGYDHTHTHTPPHSDRSVGGAGSLRRSPPPPPCPLCAVLCAATTSPPPRRWRWCGTSKRRCPQRSSLAALPSCTAAAASAACADAFSVAVAGCCSCYVAYNIDAHEKDEADDVEVYATLHSRAASPSRSSCCPATDGGAMMGGAALRCAVLCCAVLCCAVRCCCCAALRQPEVPYRLPDGSVLSVSSEKYRAPELLFHPSLVGSEEAGIHHQLVQSIARCDLDLRRALFSSIILSGGSTLFDGFGDRLLSECRRLSPRDTKIKIWAPPERILSTWIGGSILASLATFKRMWITRKEYEEQGKSSVYRKMI